MPEAVTSLGLSSHLDLFTSRCVCPPRAVTLLLPQGPEECCQPTGMLSAGKGPRLHEAIPSFAKAPPPKSTPSEGTCSKEREVAKHLLRAQATPPPIGTGPAPSPAAQPQSFLPRPTPAFLGLACTGGDGQAAGCGTRGGLSHCVPPSPAAGQGLPLPHSPHSEHH